MQKKTQYQYILLVLMLLASAAAMALRPTHRIADEIGLIKLDTMIPKQFGVWRQEVELGGQIVNPEVSQKLSTLYSETLSRTYVNDVGQRIMLSIAYGADQSDAKQLHYPEVCYPSQGFQIKSSQITAIPTKFGNIKVKRLYAVMGMRSEPVTYWTTVGNKVVTAGKEAKLEQLKYGFKGQIPDGLLFRVSSINDHAEEAYTLQEKFVNEFVSSLPAHSRLRLAGLNG